METSKSAKTYILGCAKAQGKISKLLLQYSGEADPKNKELLDLREEIEQLKQLFLQEDTFMQNKIKSIKKGGKVNLGSCYTEWMGWGGSFNTPRGGWPSVAGGGVVCYNDDGTDVKKLPFGRSSIHEVAKRGETISFDREPRTTAKYFANF